MPEPTTPPGLLLATDLSARCERPSERAKQLAGELSVPLVSLTVHEAPQAPGESPYRKLMAAIDVTAAPRLALETAARLFPQARITAFHAHDADMRVTDMRVADMRVTDVRVTDVLAPDAPPRAELIRFLDACVLDLDVRARVTLAIGEGDPASRLARHVVDNGIDLAVFGLHEESALMRLLTGSRSEHLLQEVVCDTLLVRAGEQNEQT